MDPPDKPIPSPASAPPIPDAPTKCSLNVKNVMDNQTWQIPFVPTQTVQELKAVLRVKYDQLQGKHIRLIFQGHLLNDDQQTGEAGLKNGSFVHCAASDAPPSAPPANDNEEPHENLGFQRLRYAGFSEREVAELRIHYHGRLPQNEEDEESFRTREEQWMNGDGNNGDIESQPIADMAGPMSTERRRGSIGEFFLGLFIGTFFGIFGLIWLIDRRSSHLQRLGIVGGVLFSFAFSYIRTPNINPGSSPGNGEMVGNSHSI